METVLLLQLDGKIPNLALMRLAGWHRGRGDRVELRHARTPDGVERALFDRPGRVYASLIFEKTRPVAERLAAVRPDAVIGGTGWDLARTVEDVGVPADQKPDYSDYPAFTASIGFTQRGCRLRCPFCVVPGKEGAVREAATVADIWRGEGHPRNLLLLDNDPFGQPGWRDRLAEIRAGKFKVCWNQGINARMLTEEAAAAIAAVRPWDDQFRNRRVYTAWDSRKDEDRLFAGLDALARHGIKPWSIFVFMIIGYWPGETEADWVYRATRLVQWGARPYPMPYVRTPMTVGFSRWCIHRVCKRYSWERFKAVGFDTRYVERGVRPPARRRRPSTLQPDNPAWIVPPPPVGRRPLPLASDPAPPTD